MDDLSLLALLQLADSFFPSGMVTLSHGLEAFVSLHPQSSKEIPALLDDYVSAKVAPLDLVAYAHAYRAAEAADVERLHSVDCFLTASLLPQEQRHGSARSGRAVLTTLSPLMDAPLLHAFLRGIQAGNSAGNAPVCFGLICALWETSLRGGGVAYLYAFAVSFLGAALRLGCLGHREVQRILLGLRSRLPALVDGALACELEEMGAFTPLIDIRAMQHAFLPVRLFSS